MKTANLLKAGLVALTFAGCVPEMSVPEQVLIYFGVPVQKNRFGDLIGLTETQEGYKGVSCVNYHGSGTERYQNRMNVTGAILDAKKQNSGVMYGLRPFKSRRIEDKYCTGFTMQK